MPETSYILAFKQGSPTWNLYQKLKEDGTKDSDIDQGYLKANYVNKKRSPVGKNDCKITEEEVLDYALEKYQKYQPSIKEIMDYEIPWAMDDLDPETIFDLKIREQISSAIKTFEENLYFAEFEKGTDKYHELLAVSLYAFVTSSKRLGATEIRIPKDTVKELKDAGLESMIFYIVRNGGLGIAHTANNCELEANALTALKENCGWCTEKSKILYAIFKMAGLKTNFVHGLVKYAAIKNFKGLQRYHVSVGLILETKTRFFDTALVLSDAESFYKENFDWWFLSTNREFLAVHYSNLGKNNVDRNEPDLAVEKCKKALQINSDLAEAHHNLGDAYYGKGELGPAIAEYKKALKINPNLAESHNNLGNVYDKMGKLNLAVTEYKKALKIYPNLTATRFNLGMVYQKLAKRFEKKDNISQAHAIYKKALKHFQIASKDHPRSQNFIKELQEKIKKLKRK